MGDIQPFFVVVFSRGETGTFRAEAAMRAQTEWHAALLASHLLGEGRGAVAFSQTGYLGTPGVSGVERAPEIEILARFGDVPDDQTLLGGFGRALTSSRPEGAAAPGGWIAYTLEAFRLLKAAFASALTLPSWGERQVAFRYSPVLAWVFAFAVAASACSFLGLTALAAQREARLVEMARPACDHTSTTNRELRHLVRAQYQAGASKKEALASVVAHCLSNPLPG